VTRPEFAAALLAFATPRPRSRISVEIGIKPSAPELLESFTVSIALRNSAHAMLPVDFPTTEFYRIDVLRGGTLVWTSAHGKPLAIARKIEVPPGRLPLVFYAVDSLTDDRHAFTPGPYLVRVTMLGTTLTTTYEQTVTFPPPLTVAQALASKGSVTVAGTPGIDGGKPVLTDATGTLPISRALGLHPEGIFLVRGALDRSAAIPVFTITRFAPAALATEPAPQPS
jgi:hypothetical protein